MKLAGLRALELPLSSGTSLGQSISLAEPQFLFLQEMLSWELAARMDVKEPSGDRCDGGSAGLKGPLCSPIIPVIPGAVGYCGPHRKSRAYRLGMSIQELERLS